MEVDNSSFTKRKLLTEEVTEVDRQAKAHKNADPQQHSSPNNRSAGMAAVWGTRPRKRRAAGTDEATEHLESEGDRLIKHLVDKQLNTSLSLQEQLRCERQYERRLEVGALSCGARGQTSWQQFQDRERWAELRSRGLSEEEASLLCGQTRPCLEGRVARERLADIQHRLQPAPPASSLHGRATRLELEMAGAEKACSKETRLYQFALSCRPAREDTRPPKHPIHQLRALEQQLLDRVSWRQVDPRPAVPRRVVPPARCSCGDTAGSGWDVRCACRVESRGTVPGVRSCRPQRLYTVREGRIVALEELPTGGGGEDSEVARGGEPFVGACAREDPGPRPDRLSEDQLRRLPRFCDYRPGRPSQVWNGRPLLWRQSMASCGEASRSSSSLADLPREVPLCAILSTSHEPRTWRCVQLL
ncbi:uncharacterized protein LOC134533662 isoform X2 [Bacillus rossius redtenbacheri]|uniref:uncharacterized protein LOC134533662 isoform X2 n=1 Tax=Bacillus rossius redtenbacheri TaxID=93214 RepID=UPI002FDECCD1